MLSNYKIAQFLRADVLIHIENLVKYVGGSVMAIE
jgi:hypothetical protein